ncbi:MAG: SDR family NAD(P)-dependent oxidoreductase, partial [Ilumatobacteraceae bacterium]
MSTASRFAGRVAVVTGAGSGIGAAVARRLHEDGALVAHLDLDLDAAASTAAEQPGAVAFAVDVSDPRSVDAAIADVEAAVGPIDLLAHLAGVDT